MKNRKRPVRKVNREDRKVTYIFIKKGPYAGFSGYITAVSDSGKPICVLYDLRGCQVVRSVDNTYIEKVIPFYQQQENITA